jgi:hypothetical protein
MAYDEVLVDRIQARLSQLKVEFRQMKMMGGLCFMVDNKMCLGINGTDLMARVGPGAYQDALRRPGAREMEFTGRPLKGFVFVDSEAVDLDEDLHSWIELCLRYNPYAKRSGKKS